MNRRLLVVGGSGFIGVHVARRAGAAGWTTTIVDRTPPRAEADREQDTIEFRSASVTDPDALAAAVEAVRPDAAICLAAYGLGTDGLAHGAASAPAQAVRVNVEGVANLVPALAGAGCRALVYGSSSTVYGAATPTGPNGVSEDSPLCPDGVYGATKLAAEHVARVQGAAHGIRVTSARLPLVYGEGRWYGGSQDGLVRFADDLSRGRPADLDAWTTPADWMYATDAADCLLALADHETATGAYNVSGHRSSLHDLAHALVDAGDSADGTTDVRADAGGGPDVPLMDTTRIRQDLGFHPDIDTAERGAASYTEALRNHHLREYR